MDHFHGTYCLKSEKTFMYANVYTSPTDVDFNLDIAKLLNRCIGNESCHYCGQPDPSIKVAGWIGICFNKEKMEINIIIYSDYDTPNEKVLLQKSFPCKYCGNAVELDI